MFSCKREVPSPGDEFDLRLLAFGSVENQGLLVLHYASQANLASELSGEAQACEGYEDPSINLPSLRVRLVRGAVSKLSLSPKLSLAQES